MVHLVIRPVYLTTASGVALTDVALVVTAAAFVLATLAPSMAFAIALIAGIAWLGLRVAANAPQALVEANLNALTRATATQISFAR